VRPADIIIRMENVAEKNTAIKVGDVVKITTRDPEGAKVHATPFEGLVIAIRGEGSGRTFTVRKQAADKVMVERIFPLNSPLIQNIKVIKQTRVRRAKLYYLRKKSN